LDVFLHLWFSAVRELTGNMLFKNSIDSAAEYIVLHALYVVFATFLINKIVCVSITNIMGECME